MHAKQVFHRRDTVEAKPRRPTNRIKFAIDLYDRAAAHVFGKPGNGGITVRQQPQPRAVELGIVNEPQLEAGAIGEGRHMLELAHRQERNPPRRRRTVAVKHDKPLIGLERIDQIDRVHATTRRMVR